MKFLRTFSSLCIIFIIIAFSLTNLIGFSQYNLGDDQSIFSIIRGQFCIQRIHIPDNIEDKNLIILRLDDVQAHTWRDISIQMIQDAYEYNAPIVAGIIPNTLLEDPVITRFLRRENCNIEIALHGWDHSGGDTDSESSSGKLYTEFGDILYTDARKRLHDGKLILGNLTDKKIITFIPPFNIISREAIRALKDEDFEVYSSLGDKLFDYQSTTYDFDTNQIVPVDQVLQECEEGFRKKGFCVIMLHPQDYTKADSSFDKILYESHYLGLLDRLKDRGVFVTFQDIIAIRAQ